jgi:hypothetical protein
MFHPSQPGMLFKRCAERTVDTCDSGPTDGCCAIIDCAYCLRIRMYGEDDQEGIAAWNGAGWAGTVAGTNFFAYWERSYHDDECEFIVTLDDVEIYRGRCGDYTSANCRDNSGEVSVAINYETGTLTWERYNPLPLQPIDVAGCIENFCGDCKCTCRELCVIVDGELATGSLVLSPYDCPAPEWSGTVTTDEASHDITATLQRNEYTGECELTTTIDGEEQNPVTITDCGAIEVAFEINYNTIVLRCKRCACVATDSRCCGRVLPDQLTLFIADLQNCTCDGWVGQSITLNRVVNEAAGTIVWLGCIVGPCTVINGVDTNQELAVQVTCTSGPIGQAGSPVDLVLAISNIADPCEVFSTDPVASFGTQTEDSSCNPFLIKWAGTMPIFNSLCQDPMAGLPTVIGELWLTL